MKTPRERAVVLREGEVTFSRRVYECPCCRRSHAPVDEELGVMPHERLSRGVRELASWHASRSSFEDAAETLAHCHGLAVSSSEVARVAHAEGARLAGAQGEIEERWSEPVTGDAPVYPPEIEAKNLVLELDGTVVLTRAGEEHKTVWCGRGFDAGMREEDESGRPFIVDSRYTAQAGTLDEFEHSFLALANRMGARSARRIAVVADGAEPLWNLVERCVPHAVQIQDFWHVAERLHGLARDLWSKEEEQRENAGRWRVLLSEGHVDELIAVLRASRRAARGARRRRLTEEIGYLEKGRHRMDYPRYRREGWPVGSGAIEGTCKHLVKERFNLTGARWRRGQIQDVLSLRVAQFNKEWDRHWEHRAA